MSKPSDERFSGAGLGGLTARQSRSGETRLATRPSDAGAMHARPTAHASQQRLPAQEAALAPVAGGLGARQARSVQTPDKAARDGATTHKPDGIQPHAADSGPAGHAFAGAPLSPTPPKS